MTSVRLQDTQSICKYKVYLYMLVMNKLKIKLRKESFYNITKKYKILSNKFNQKVEDMYAQPKTTKHY